MIHLFARRSHHYETNFIGCSAKTPKNTQNPYGTVIVYIYCACLRGDRRKSTRGQIMTIQNAASSPVAQPANRQNGRGKDEETESPPDYLGGETAAKTQEGQPGLPDPEEKEWSPGAGRGEG
jgi:hypothetical protein